ncbi:transglycosylase domain-containing protein [bacterium]|nr:transglycosylase domain-containing protein [bacterium]
MSQKSDGKPVFQTLKRALVLLLILCILGGAASYLISRAVDSKLSEITGNFVSSIKKGYGLDLRLSGMKTSLLPPSVKLDSAELSNAGSSVLKLKSCAVRKLSFSSQMEPEIFCDSAEIYGGEIVTAAKALVAVKTGKVSPNPAHPVTYGSRISDRISKFTLSIEKMSFVYGMFSESYRMDYAPVAGSNKVLLRQGDQLLELFFDSKFNDARLRLEKFDLSKLSGFFAEGFGLALNEGSVDARIGIARENTSFTLHSDITIQDLNFLYPLFDSAPFSLPFFRFLGDISLDALSQNVSIKDAKLTLGGLDADFSLTRTTNSIRVDAKPDTMQLNRLATLIGTGDIFRDFLLGGTLTLDLGYQKNADEEPVFSISGEVTDPQQLSERLNYLKGDFEYTFTNADGRSYSFRVGPSNPRFARFDDLPTHLVWAVLVSEDAGFYLHKGVAFEELDAAVKDNVKKHRLRGGSTITQQIAKNLFLTREKTLLRKLRELLLAIELDATLSKNRLLEIYFNIVEWAPGVFGITNAANYYFGKTPEELSPMESAYLASIIPGPSKYHYQFLTNNVSERWYDHLYRILTLMHDTGHITLEEYLDSMREAVIFREREE